MKDFERYSAENFIWITTYMTLSFSRNLTFDEMNLWGNVLSAVGSNLCALSSIYEANLIATAEALNSNNDEA